MTQVVLRAHPTGTPDVDDFALETIAIPTPAPGEVLLRTLWLALDPLIRFTLDEVLLTGFNKVPLGGVIYGPTISQVIASQNPDFAAGDIVEGRTGWREYAAVDPAISKLTKVKASAAPSSAALGALGMPGQTAHAAIVAVGRVKEGETVVISAAAGAVGSTAGQIAKILGARVIGIAGGPQKCAAVKALGFDECVDYKDVRFASDLAAACPGGIDVYLESVGGAVTRTVLPLMKYGGRVPIAGYISYYGIGMEGPGPDHLPGFMRMVMARGLEVKGFSGMLLGTPAVLDELTRWFGEGKLKCPETVVDGLKAAPRAFSEVFRGNDNIGKLVVKVQEPG